MFHFQSGLLIPINEQPGRTTGAEFAGFIRGELITAVNFSRRNSVAGTDRVQFQPQQAVGVFKVAVLDVKREAAQKTGFGDDDASYSRTHPNHAVAPRIVEVGADAV